MGKLAVAAITSLWVIPMSMIVNHIVPDPYMDEIFHVPQAQQYCNGNLKSWDPMITTPPGLYYLSLAHIASLFPGMLLMRTTASQSFSEACSTSVLRSTNAVFAVLCGVLVFEIIKLLGPNLSDRKATLMALVMTLYPLHWFFNFLYYTDVASLTAFLAMYLASLRKRYFLSALFGALAIFIRQTNVVWMLFVACSGVLDFTLDLPRQKEKQKVDQASDHESIDGKEATLRSSLRKRKPDSSLGRFDRAISTSSTDATKGLVYDVYTVIKTSWSMKWKLLVTFSPFIVVVLAFGVFIIWNGGIVLGAKEDHVVSPHFAQIMYFSLVSAVFTAPLHFSVAQLRTLLQELRINWPLSLVLTLVALIAGFASIHFFSLAHPYLLADNRHYPFYLWRKIINAHWLMKYMLVPVYIYSWFSILTLLAKNRRKIWVLVYFLATCAVLVPTPLIEFRYYTIPFYIFMLHSSVRNSGCATWLLIGTIFVCINVFTMGMFLFRPFKWSHEDGVQRFIW
ncbi:Dol-P-Glc:Glc(2)Man(9)GlcNAc(2)-PP-Dol alpha-1,2-glucosyltransferase [Hirschfeldia incana]|nr:Dol-P-Glc:Glc(2)Man(9)GlcNAc(2)-PP-Dol alpha-1,2-glucosyltransferase [Hirschfeldia incana]